MRALPDLSPLSPQPSVWQQSTDDWNGIFANEFASMGSQQAGADRQINTIYPAMDPISSAIDALGGILDEATNILGILSGDLDLVDLTPEINNYQANEAALYDGFGTFALNPAQFAPAFVDLFTGLFNANFLFQMGPVVDFINELAYEIGVLFNEVGQIFIAVFG